VATLKGCSAVVSGASRGIGRAISIALAKEGVNLCLLSRNVEALEKLVGECASFGVRAFACGVDLADQSSTETLRKALARVETELGGLEILVNNAGLYGSFEDSLESWEKVMQVNAVSLMKLTKLCLPLIEKSAEGSKRCGVINIGSVAGKMSFGPSSPYCASKHAVVGFTAGLFEQVRSKGIKVSCLNPGYVNTDMPFSNANKQLDGSKMIQSEDIAETVLFVLKAPSTMCPTEIYIRPQFSPYVSS